MNRKKILYMGEPVLTTYDTYNSLTSIVSDQKNFYDWVYNNFISICTYRGTIFFYDGPAWFLYNCPWIYTQTIPKKFVEDKWDKSLKQFIIESIDLDYYLYFHIDWFYITDSYCYNIRHFIHTTLFYGYDLDENIVYAAGNIDNGKYGLIKITFDDMEKAYWQWDSDIEEWDWILDDERYTSVHLLKKYKNETYDIDFRQVKTYLHDYLNSNYTHKAATVIDSPELAENYIYGFEALYLLIWSISNSNNEYLDKRVFHLLWEHKVIMHKRLKFMTENSYLQNGDYFSNAYAELIPKYQTLLSIALKYNMTKDKNLLTKICKYLEEYIINEKELVTGIIENIVHLKVNNCSIIGNANGVFPNNSKCVLFGREAFIEYEINFNYAKDKYVYIKCKTTYQCEAAQLCFISKSWLAAKDSKIFVISPQSELFEYIIDMSDERGWHGVMSQLRFYPAFDSISEKGECDIEYIKVCSRLPIYDSKKDYIKTQGVNGWGYYTYNNGIIYREMIWSETNMRWQDVKDENLYADINTQTSSYYMTSVRKWTCPTDGKYKITYEYGSKTDNEYSTLKIRDNHRIIYVHKFDKSQKTGRITQEKVLDLERGEILSFEYYSTDTTVLEIIELYIKIEKLSDKCDIDC